MDMGIGGIGGGLGKVAGEHVAQDKIGQAKRLEKSGDSAQAAQEFERLLAGIFVKQLRSTLKNGFFPKGPGNDAYNSWLDDALGIPWRSQESWVWQVN